MIKKLDNSNTEVANKIFTIFQNSYKIEAEIIGVLDFPPLLRSAKDIENSKKMEESVLNLEKTLLKGIDDSNKNMKKIILEASRKNDSLMQEVKVEEKIKYNKLTLDIEEKLRKLSMGNVGNELLSSFPKVPEIKSFSREAKNTSVLSSHVSKDKTFQNIEVIAEYTEEVAEEIEEEAYDIETLSANNNNDDNDAIKMPSFTLMPGPVRGIITAGADVGTMQQGAENPKIIWISLNSEQFIANNEVSDIRDCMVQVTARGNIASGRARMIVKKLSCIMTDKKGNKYKIVKEVKGGKGGEDGKK